MNQTDEALNISVSNTCMEERKQQEAHDRNSVILLSFLMAAAFTLMSAANIWTHSDLLASTAIGAALFFAGAVCTWLSRQKRVGVIISSFTIAVIFSWYTVIGGNDGFAVLWILIVPSISMVAFGLHEGVVLSLYFQLFLIVLFYTPLKDFLPYHYGSVFMFRFPLLYCIDFVSAIAGFRLLNKFQAENMQYRRKLLSYNDELKREVKSQTVKIENFSNQLIEALAKTIDAKDKYTNGHSLRVAKYSRMLAAEMGKNEQEQNNIYNIGMLHDIGKIGIQAEIINKTSKLTDEEYDIIKTHPLIGSDILNTILEMPEIAIGARWHHERYDGKGYPDRLKGEDIPEIARIIGVADAYDAMTSNRSYRKALPQEIVRNEIKRGKGTQFDPVIADLMLNLIDQDTDYCMKEED